MQGAGSNQSRQHLSGLRKGGWFGKQGREVYVGSLSPKRTEPDARHLQYLPDLNEWNAFSLLRNSMHRRPQVFRIIPPRLNRLSASTLELIVLHCAVKLESRR